MVLNLSSLINESSEFLNSEFNIRTEKSKLKIYSPEEWKQFCTINDFVLYSDGIYVPKSYLAYVNSGSDLLITNIFHEFFGHGLFCECSAIGKNLVNIIDDKERAYNFLYGSVDSNIQPLGLAKKNIWNYEGFALWLESLLCEETGNKSVWNSKKNRISKEDYSLFQYFQRTEKELTRFGFMSQLGFPKYYDYEKIVTLLKHYYGINFSNIDMILLYGSQKPESDVDLFIVSKNKTLKLFNGFLDIYELNRHDINNLLDNLDIEVTDPLFSGTLIYGDRKYFEKLKQYVINLPITNEAVSHNFWKAREQRSYLPHFKDNSKSKASCISYISSYTINAERLRMGNKSLTLGNLIN